jgi:muramidase (phage lysozyme)
MTYSPETTSTTIAALTGGTGFDSSLMRTNRATGQINNVQNAIANASAVTGVDFSYLMQKANTESSMNPDAKAKNSSATGLYQFIDKTWLQMVRDHGEKYGLKSYAKCIDDNCHVDNNSMRQKILDLRKDPKISACMAAEYAVENANILESRVGDIAEIGKTELYLAHFLGPTGATKFLQAMHDNPDTRAAQIFPNEARRNHNVFYDADTGKARTIKDVYAMFNRKFSDEVVAVESHESATLPRSLFETPVPAHRLKPLQNAECAPVMKDVAETPVTLTQLQVQDLLDMPTTPFPGAEPLQRQEQMAQRRATEYQLRSSALLVLAQNYAHNDNDRYNS